MAMPFNIKCPFVPTDDFRRKMILLLWHHSSFLVSVLACRLFTDSPKRLSVSGEEHGFLCSEKTQEWRHSASWHREQASPRRWDNTSIRGTSASPARGKTSATGQVTSLKATRAPEAGGSQVSYWRIHVTWQWVGIVLSQTPGNGAPLEQIPRNEDGALQSGSG